ncbi:MAG: hypothetical protein NVSMB24_28810 [Mucilaginibacter sp.]
MIYKEGPSKARPINYKEFDTDLVVVGGGIAGTCCAISAARTGVKVILVQDRPVLGGNASSEVRLWILGATSHMGNNNRWAREGGVIDELLVENMYRNPDGNPVIFDTIILEWTLLEPNIKLLLNTSVFEVEKENDNGIKSVKAFCSQNSTMYNLSAPLFCDASGDGIVGFLAGAAFRMGAESREEFGEKFAPNTSNGELLGHSIYFYTKDIGKPVKYVPPSYALMDITTIPKYKNFNTTEQGCQLWWIEYGGQLDTVYDTEDIKWELWKVVYGVWGYIKNSGNFPDAENLTLEWVGTIPGKRESRRFEGDYILKQQDIVEQIKQPDAVSFGGWSIDLHPAEGIYSSGPGCSQWHAKGVYTIPYRSLYSRNISNLFLAGRIISATHVAFASTRVMATCAVSAQAVGIAAALCIKKKLIPAEVFPDYIPELQKQIVRSGNYIPGIALADPDNIATDAVITVSSELILSELPADGDWLSLSYSTAQMIPLDGTLDKVSFYIRAKSETDLIIQLRISSKAENHTPDIILIVKSYHLAPGLHQIDFAINNKSMSKQYGFICCMVNEEVDIMQSQFRVTGLLSVFNQINPAVSNYGKQSPPDDIGVDTFEFWTPKRRPQGRNLAMKFNPPQNWFGALNINNGLYRPVRSPNAWVPDPLDNNPTLTMAWETVQIIQTIEIYFDNDFDHPMESTLMGHPEHIMPFCVNNFVIYDDQCRRILELKDNHHSIYRKKLEEKLETSKLIIRMDKGKQCTVALFGIKVYS